jgi:hypothetical protein
LIIVVATCAVGGGVGTAGQPKATVPAPTPVLYEMAAGQRAFAGETAAILHDAILHQTPIAVHDLNSTLPPGLARIIDKAIEKDRERRYQSAMEMLADFVKTVPHKMSPGPVRGWKFLAAVLVLTAIFSFRLASVFQRAGTGQVHGERHCGPCRLCKRH